MYLKGLVLFFFLVEVFAKPKTKETKGYVSNQTEKLNFYDAYAKCIEKGLELPIIKSENCNEKLTKEASIWGSSATFWISGKKEGSDFSWFPKSSKMSYTNWETGYPKEGNGNCLLFKSNGRWENEDCDDKARFICVPKKKNVTGFFNWLKEKTEGAFQSGSKLIGKTLDKISVFFKKINPFGNTKDSEDSKDSKDSKDSNDSEDSEEDSSSD